MRDRRRHLTQNAPSARLFRVTVADVELRGKLGVGPRGVQSPRRDGGFQQQHMLESRNSTGNRAGRRNGCLQSRKVKRPGSRKVFKSFPVLFHGSNLGDGVQDFGSGESGLFELSACWSPVGDAAGGRRPGRISPASGEPSRGTSFTSMIDSLAWRSTRAGVEAYRVPSSKPQPAARH